MDILDMKTDEHRTCKYSYKTTVVIDNEDITIEYFGDKNNKTNFNTEIAFKCLFNRQIHKRRR